MHSQYLLQEVFSPYDFFFFLPFTDNGYESLYWACFTSLSRERCGEVLQRIRQTEGCHDQEWILLCGKFFKGYGKLRDVMIKNGYYFVVGSSMDTAN